MTHEPITHVPNTDPYPWPYDGCLDGERLAVVLAGWDENWASRCLDVDSMKLACNQLVDAVTAFGGIAITVAHNGAVSLSAPVFSSPGEIFELTAAGLDGFFASPLDHLLRQHHRTHLLLAGLGLEGPVHSTLRTANDQGYECLLVVDSSAPIISELSDAAAKTVTMSGGIFGAIGELNPVLDTLSAQLQEEK